MKDVQKLWNFKLFRISKSLDTKISHGHRKVDAAGRFFGFTKHGDLMYEKPGMVPFEDLKISKNLKTYRLSVTKLLTKSWCELKFAYDAYSKLPVFRDKRIRKGEQVHKFLEEQTLEPAMTLDMIPGIEEALNVKSDELHKLATNWFDSTNRMLGIFHRGEAREVICHGYVNHENGSLFDPKFNPTDDQLPKLLNNHVLVSGIVDHLSLYKISDDATVEFDSNKNMGETIKYITRNMKKLRRSLTIDVGDVKTRSSKSVPSQQTIIKASKTQVMYYRYFLEILGRDPAITYQLLLANARARGLDPDRPLNIGNVMWMAIQSSNIIDDFIKLHNGELFGFEKFDSEKFLGNTSMELGSLEYEYLGNIEANQEKASTLFNGPFVKPVTLKYFAMRLAQTYYIIGNLLSDQLNIEYYHDNENFKTLGFSYDEKVLLERCKDASGFWFGKRPIEPINPTISNYDKYCRLCDYKDHCSWAKKTVEANSNLGKELGDIINRTHGYDSI
ncbi:Exonuclease V, mitochondrial [Nakaseomyces bracarensis]|uniref:Exonuclease V, mitochondrial n=1 Tax=Nakaseomyces bracarensis TaxID=273131 RepID=A0ABR4P153_9SACH